MKGYRHNNMHLQRGAAIQRDKDRMFLLGLNLRNVNINMLTDDELKFLARHEAEHMRQFGHPSGGPDKTAAGHSNATIRGYHDLPYYVYTESDNYPDGHSYRTVNGDAGWGGLPEVPAVDDERYPINIDPNATGDEEYLSTHKDDDYLPGTNIYKHKGEDKQEVGESRLGHDEAILEEDPLPPTIRALADSFVEALPEDPPLTINKEKVPWSLSRGDWSFKGQWNT